MRYGTLAGIVLMAAAVVNCSDSLEPNSLIGTWDATELRFTNLANASQSVDVIGDEDGAFTLVLSANGAYEITVTLPDEDPDVTTGTWVYTDLDGLTLTETGDVDGTDISVSLSGDTMTISSTDGVTFDFGDGDVNVRLQGTLVRR